ncbi:MAG: restriction endonuclease [Acidobacteriia bacterium]|nr:restriction endonuclease [Terriglobia bacterium]
MSFRPYSNPESSSAGKMLMFGGVGMADERPEEHPSTADDLLDAGPRASKRIIPEKLIGLDDHALSVALVEINNAAKRQRDMASAHYEAKMHGLAKSAKETKEFLYSLKDDVLRRLVSQERARLAGYHSKPDPRGAVQFVRRWVPDPYDDDDDDSDYYDRPKEWVAIPNPKVTVDSEGYAVTYMESIEFCGRRFHRPLSSFPEGAIVAAQIEEELSPATSKRYVRRKDAEHTLRQYLRLPNVLIQAELLVFGKSVDEGRVVEALSIPWIELCRQILEDERLFYEFARNPRKFEEFVAGSYKKMGWTEVVLTPRSNDQGRDIIAVLPGQFSIRILDQCKAYSPGHRVTAEEVRAMLGVLTGDRNATKAIVTTTSSFAPGIEGDSGLAPFMPHRLQLRNGKSFRDSLRQLYPSDKVTI